MLRKINRIWFQAGQHPLEIGISFLLAGIVLCLWSFAIGVGDVQFNGKVAGITIQGAEDLVTKQVGFLWAPNWGLTSVFLIPICIYLLCAARGTIEDTIRTLITRKMLRRTDGAPVNEAEVLEAWDQRSATWVVPAIVLVTIAVLSVIFLDFKPVVMDWLLNEAIATDALGCETPPFKSDGSRCITLQHSTFEFDWSIAKILDESSVGLYANMAFSLVAYLYVAVFGAGIVIGALIWFIAFASFMEPKNLARHDLELVPDIHSTDPRSGFEVFEAMYMYMIYAVVFTAFIALAMHLQNVFLRAPEFGNIFEMTFGGLQPAFDSLASGKFAETINLLVSMRDALNITGSSGINLQIIATALGMFILALLMSLALVIWPQISASRGKQRLLADKTLTDKQSYAIYKMSVWPAPAMPRTFVATLLVMFVMSLIYVNFLTLLLAALILNSVAPLLGSLVKKVISRDMTYEEFKKSRDEDKDTKG